MEAHKGNYYARNVGIDNSRGKYVAVMDADDIAKRERFEVQFAYMQVAEVGCVGTQGYYIDVNDNVLKNFNVPTNSEALKVSLLKNNFLMHSSLFFNKEFLEKHISLKYNEDYLVASDFDLITRCASNSKIVNLQERLMCYRIHANQITTTQREQQKNIAKKVRMSQIKALGIRYSSNEINIYNDFMENIVQSREHIEIVRKIFNRILVRNHSCSIYSQDELYDFLQSLIKNAFFHLVE